MQTHNETYNIYKSITEKYNYIHTEYMNESYTLEMAKYLPENSESIKIFYFLNKNKNILDMSINNIFNNMFNLNVNIKVNIKVNNDNNDYKVDNNDNKLMINMAKKFIHIENINIESTIKNDPLFKLYISPNIDNINSNIDNINSNIDNIINENKNINNNIDNIINYDHCIKKIMFILNFTNEYDRFINTNKHVSINTLGYLIYLIEITKQLNLVHDILIIRQIYSSIIFKIIYHNINNLDDFYKRSILDINNLDNDLNNDLLIMKNYIYN